jgi:hypothetical protein
MVVYLVDLVCLVHRVGLVQPNIQDKPNKPIKRVRPDTPNGQDRLADFFSCYARGGVYETDSYFLCRDGNHGLFQPMDAGRKVVHRNQAGCGKLCRFNPCGG